MSKLEGQMERKRNRREKRERRKNKRRWKKFWARRRSDVIGFIISSIIILLVFLPYLPLTLSPSRKKLSYFSSLLFPSNFSIFLLSKLLLIEIHLIIISFLSTFIPRILLIFFFVQLFHSFASKSFRLCFLEERGNFQMIFSLDFSSSHR